MEDIEGGVNGVMTKRRTKVETKTRIKKTNNKFDELVKLHVKYGWRKTYISKNIDVDMIHVRNADNLLSQLLKDYDKLPPNKQKLTIDTLYELGFKKTFAKLYFEVIEKLINTWYSDYHLLEFIVEFALDQYSTIGLPGQVYLYDNEEVDTWFRVNDILCYNVRNKKITEEILDIHNINSKKNLMVYHACAWSYAASIISDGVNRQVSRECLDFGFFQSFYMTPDIKTAFKWCEMKNNMWKEECVVVAFKLPLNILSRKDNFKKCVYLDQTIEWTQNVKESRYCVRTQKKVQYLDKFDMVYGPMCANVYQIFKYGHEPACHNPMQFQMASKSDRFDEFLTKNFHSIICLPSGAFASRDATPHTPVI